MGMNGVCHIEFESTDFARSRKFYEDLFGWSFREFGPMMVFGNGEGHVGGLSKAETVHPMPFTSVWLQVADVDAVLAKAPGVGGSVLKEKYQTPEVGWCAEIADPDGNPIGVVQFPEG